MLEKNTRNGKFAFLKVIIRRTKYIVVVVVVVFRSPVSCATFAYDPIIELNDDRLAEFSQNDRERM